MEVKFFRNENYDIYLHLQLICSCMSCKELDSIGVPRESFEIMFCYLKPVYVHEQQVWKLFLKLKLSNSFDGY